METAISRVAAAGLAAASLALMGCGAQSTPSRGSAAQTSAAAAHTSSAARTTGTTKAFAWLHPGPAPASWHIATIPSGASMAYPPGWQKVQSDAGTASAALFAPDHRFLGYLNITPQQGDETLANFGRFRVEHNAEDHDHAVTALAVGRRLRFRTGQGTCVRDSYVTDIGARYIELACLVAGRRAHTVIIAAAPPTDWDRVSPALERVISSFMT